MIRRNRWFDVRPPSAAKPGREGRRDNEYQRGGTANVFCAVEPKAGHPFTCDTPDRSAPQFAQTALELALAYRDARTIHLVRDNLNIHRRQSLTELYGADLGGEIWGRFTHHQLPNVCPKDLWQLNEGPAVRSADCVAAGV